MEAVTHFDVKLGLTRLVTRCPELVEDIRIASLLSLEKSVSENEIVPVLRLLLLRPHLTVTVAGCFRPILSELVSDLVQSLHKIFSESRSSVNASELMQWNLMTHEYACVAMSRILEFAPHLLSTLLQYFAFAPPAFERLLRRHVNNKKDEPSLLDIVRASYRFLQLEPKSFRELWCWSPFLDLLQWTADDASKEHISDIRWCAVQVLSLVFRMSDAATRDLSFSISKLSEEEAFSCIIRWEEFGREISVEKSAAFMDVSTCSMDIPQEQCLAVDYKSVVKWKQGEGNTVSHVLICGIELPVRQDSSVTKQISSRSFILTSSVRAHLECIAISLSQRQPILLEGPVGSGKSSLIREVAHLTGNSDVLFIHLDDQMDSKMLLGNYVCTEIPGEFKWQPGALTQAVAKGLWVVFEDIDKAPSEVFAALGGLLENRRLYIPGRGEVINAAEGFRLFATVSRVKFGSTWTSGEGRESFSYLWRKVVVQGPSDDELSLILKTRFPGLDGFVPKLIGTLNMVKDIASPSRAQLNSQGGVFIHIGRQFSMRDLFKLCKRLEAIISQAPVVDSIRDKIYLEAVDCFVACISSTADRQLVMRAIAEHWDVPFQRVEYYDKIFKPSVQECQNYLQIGRVFLQPAGKKTKGQNRVFAETRHTMKTLEQVARCIEQQEPVLLVGETGTGKTTLIQRLAWQMAMPLVVVNLSQQSDAADILGGFKPVEARSVCYPLVETFNRLFSATFSLQKNRDFWVAIQELVEKKKWSQLLKAIRMAVAKVGKLVESKQSTGNDEEKPSKRQRPLSSDLLDSWRGFSLELNKAERQVEAAKNAFAFSFVEGALVKALKDGSWILLDEVNLAPVEVLERLNGVFDGNTGSICLTERGDLKNIQRNPNFRVFACMNPATDVGKQDLPVLLRNRFTEVYVDEMTAKEDLENLVYRYLEGAIPSPPVEAIVSFYMQAREEAEKRLLDGAGHKPQYSLRSLSRALEFTRTALPVYGFQRALYDGVCMSFLTLLDRASASVMEQLIERVLFKQTGKTGNVSKLFSKSPPQPSPTHVLFEQFWVESGAEKQSDSRMEFCQRYVLTKSIRDHLKNIARAVFIRKYPVLLQGPTSSGKTSLVEYLAIITRHRFVRINNHEHTDLQEYIGSYVTDHTGKLVFQEGILVEAVRNGYWVVLDELNLAPSDVLEALNRLLDDNRELFVPELQVTIKPHPHFMLFATQNPPGIYAGRKALSRAFRNRFIELHVDDIPDGELSAILEKRCDMPASYAGKMVEVMKDLQRHRQGSKVFAGKHGYITPRDLFRWAERHRKSGITYDDLAWYGYLLLAERIRDCKEKYVVQTTLEKHLRVQINPEKLYEELSGLSKLQQSTDIAAFGRIVWTKSMRRLFHLAEQCVVHNESMLLVGETGCGKTTVCQLLALALGQKLHILNCHQHTETSDFLGGFRPVRARENIALKYRDGILKLNAVENFDWKLSLRIEDAAETLMKIREAMKIVRENSSMELLEKELASLHKDWQSLFIWHDGPLVTAMRNGDLVLIDEISLADDSVLERLNSVLEPKGCLVLAEKGGQVVEELVAHPNFRVMATMNPGGDFGKKELSPALRNRFTEVWVPPISDLDDIKSIITDRLSEAALVDPLLDFWKWFQVHQENGRLLSVRDLLSWIDYINSAAGQLGTYAAFVHGAFLVLLDGLGLGSGLSNEGALELKKKCTSHLLDLLPENGKAEASVAASIDDRSYYSVKASSSETSSDTNFGIHPFYISKGSGSTQNTSFEIEAPTTSRNAMRILRALRLPKPVLLEGSPGVGKTSLVSALAAMSHHQLVRINLSEQTDIMDLFGSDLPVEGGKPGEFRWSDGVFLQALKAGNWVLLDELNLASQSVLEGLNSCLDHRSELYIPEIGQVFKCPSSFRVFACQNPLREGGGRKGLPKSFLNRFTKVYVEPLSSDDFVFIAKALHPNIPEVSLMNMIQFNSELHEEIMVHHAYGHSGSPWEFNLRDILRWCSLIEDTDEGMLTMDDLVGYFVNAVYLQRFRSREDRRRASDLFKRVFGRMPPYEISPRINISPTSFSVGVANLNRLNHDRAPRDLFKQLQLIPGTLSCLESVMHCVKQGWMCMLVGPPKSGKTSLIRTLADLTGHALHEYSLSGSTDTTELLGCYEQHDIYRCWSDLFTRANNSAEAVCSFCLSSLDLPAERRLATVKSIMASWSMLSQFQSIQKDRDLIAAAGKVNSVLSGVLTQLLEQLESALSLGSLSLDFGLKNIRSSLNVLMQSLESEKTAGRFEWVDGDLLRAVERGDWVLLENANLCNPTVLDRLNPLLEPSGKIMINERGLVNGQAMTIQAHPNFRLFLTLDPNNGEVSRAMRNRGVEVYMQTTEQETSYQDLKALLAMFNIPGLQLANMMCKVHVEVKSLTEKGRTISRISLREFFQWISLLHMFVDRGVEFGWGVSYSWTQSYLPCIDGDDLQAAAREIFCSSFSGLDFGNTSLYMPGGWPNPLAVREYSLRSEEAMVKRDCCYVEFLGSKLVTGEIMARGRALMKTGIGNTELLKWLESIKSLAIYFPAALMRFYLNPQFDGVLLSEGGSGSSEISRMLHYSVLVMLEQAPFLRLGSRIQWLRGMRMKMGSLTSIRYMIAALEAEEEHPVRLQLKSAYYSFLKLAENKKQGKPMLRCFRFSDMVDSANYFSNTEDDLLTTWELVIQLSLKLQCLRRSLLQWQAEDDYLQSQTFQSKSPVMQVYPFLESVRRLENELLLSTIPHWASELDNMYIELMDSHEAVWKAAVLPNVEAEYLEFCLICGRRVIQRMLADKSLNEVKLQQSLERVLCLLDNLTAGCSVKPYLWKFGGHPQLPHSAEYSDLEQKVREACGKLYRKDNEVRIEDVVLNADVEIRHIVLEGASMISWMGQMTATISPVSENFSGPGNYSESYEMFKMLMERLELEKSNIQKPASWQLIPSRPNINCNRAVLCFSKELLCWTSCRELWATTRPWADHISLVLDGTLLAFMLPAVAAYSDPTALLQLGMHGKYLQYCVSFALSNLSRSPVDFVPHQHILWILDAKRDPNSGLVASVRDKIHELLFAWHSGLWNTADVPVKDFSRSWLATKGACRLFQASETVSVTSLFSQQVQAKDFSAKTHQLNVMLSQFWYTAERPRENSFKMDFLRASAAFQQILHAHAKSFQDKESFLSALSALHLEASEDKRPVQRISELEALAKQSIHRGILENMDLIFTCARLLYLTPWAESTFSDSLIIRGRVWLLIGELRVRLLLSGFASDPMAKYIYKKKRLFDNTEEAEFELRVRQESKEFVGCGSRLSLEKLLQKLDMLREELRTLETKIVPRPNPSQFRGLIAQMKDFMATSGNSEKINSFIATLSGNVYDAGSKIIDEIAMWQENAHQFVNQISQFQAYRDVLQPIQLGIFELKYGVSLMLGGCLGVSRNESRNYLEIFMCSLMQFPKAPVSQVQLNVGNEQACTAADLTSGAMEKLVEMSVSVQGCSGGELKTMELETKISVLRLSLMRLMHEILLGRLMTLQHIKLLKTLFASIVALWRQIRASRKAEEEEKAQQIRLTVHKMETEEEESEASYKKLFPSYWSLESDNVSGVDHGYHWQQLASSEETSSLKSAEVQDKALLSFQDDMLADVVEMHNRIFTLGKAAIVSSNDRVDAFLLGYDTGRSLLGGLGHALSKEVDRCLVSAHMMRLAVENERLQTTTDSSINLYKGSYPSELSRMLEPLSALLKRIAEILEEWPEHPILLQVTQFIESLISIPLSAPIMKGLTGLELVLSKAQLWEQNAPKRLSLVSELDGISQLVLYWRKKELHSWPALFDDLDKKHENNADKLWFSFYDVLHKCTEEGEAAVLDTAIQSIEEFVLSAPVGEYQRRLQLLVAFSAELCFGSKLTADKSHLSMTKVAAGLCNIFQYYSQFTHLVEENRSSGRAPIEKDLKDFIRICKWDDRSFYSVMSTCEKAHRKLHKLIRKYDEALKRPVSDIMKKSNSELRQLQIPVQGEDLPTQDCPVVSMQENIENHWQLMCNAASYTENTGAYERKLLTVSSKMAPLLASNIFSKTSSEVRQDGAFTLESLAATVIVRATELREGKQNRAVKKKALTDLRKRLKEIGLSYHKTDIPKDMRNVKSWFQQPNAAIHALITTVKAKLALPAYESNLGGIESLLVRTTEETWDRAKYYYFSNIAVLQQLYSSSLNYNKDLSLPEVQVFMRYMEHALYLQQKHRLKSQAFFSSLASIYTLTSQIQSFGDDDLVPRQRIVRKFMWDQKYLFDKISDFSAEATLFLNTFEKVQVCASQKEETATLKSKISGFFDKLQFGKNRLDEFLIPHDTINVAAEDIEASYPLLITATMAESVKENFKLVHDMSAFITGMPSSGSVFATIHQLLNKGMEMSAAFVLASSSQTAIDLNLKPETDDITSHYDKVVMELRLTCQRFQALAAKEVSVGDMEEKKIQEAECVFDELVRILNLDGVYKKSLAPITTAAEILGEMNDEDQRVSFVKFLRSLCTSLEMLEAAGMQVLSEYVSMQKALSKLGYVVSNVLNHLFRDGFCGAADESDEAETSEKMREAEGTGMGEGEGKKDVSEQIEEEDQLLGASEQKEEAAASNEAQKKQEKGIEMQEEFDGDMFDLSEDESEDDDDDDNKNEEEKLESKMGENDENAEVVDEKQWEEDDEESPPQDGPEKFEEGAAITAKNDDDLEMRGKNDEQDDKEEKSTDKQKDTKKPEAENPADDDKGDGDEKGDDASPMDEDDAYEDATGVKPRPTEAQQPENLENSDNELSDEQLQEQQEEAEPDLGNLNIEESMEMSDGEGEDKTEKKGGDVEADDASDKEESANGEAEGEGEGDDENKNVNSTETLEAPNAGEGNEGGNDMEMMDDLQVDQNVKNEKNGYGVATSNSKGHPLPNNLDNQMQQPQNTSADGSEQQKGTDNGPSSQEQSYAPASSSPPANQSSNLIDRQDANPYRSLGDALKKWKERVRMVENELNPSSSSDAVAVAAPSTENDMAEEDEADADAYKYVSNDEESNEQKLGAATDEQLQQSDELQKKKQFIEDDKEEVNVGVEDMSVDHPPPFQEADPNSTLQSQSKANSHPNKQSAADASKELEDADMMELAAADGNADDDDESGNASKESMVWMKRLQQEEKNEELSLLQRQWDDDEVRTVRKEVEMELINGGSNNIESARKIWQRYEQLTGRLSHELAEQLRLILEPTLAARLQGDYRSGKRLNMKKVIPYIASEFRKDKIWLRRTKASKRQYQIVLAIDDSRSMLETHCGHVALEAMITICRAMTHLEIGQMAVASFGKKGNVRVLHDFDQPFSSEAGIKMVSEFSFTQDNKITDEPMVDLLQSLTRMLDTVAAAPSSSSCRTNLQQLVLIIADGRFHEKENLRRCVRDALSRKQLLAFIVVDNSKESLLDMQSVVFSSGAPLFTKYMDSFPFPYYIVLQDIESLPRTLADLLRQWFELMQHTS